MSSGHDPNPTEARGCFAIILTPRRSFLLILPPVFPSLPPLSFPFPTRLVPPAHPSPSAWCLLAALQPQSHPGTSCISRSATPTAEHPPSHQEGATSEPAPLNSFYYRSHFTKCLIAATSPRLSQSDTHRCSCPRRPTLWLMLRAVVKKLRSPPNAPFKRVLLLWSISIDSCESLEPSLISALPTGARTGVVLHEFGLCRERTPLRRTAMWERRIPGSVCHKWVTQRVIISYWKRTGCALKKISQGKRYCQK